MDAFSRKDDRWNRGEAIGSSNNIRMQTAAIKYNRKFANYFLVIEFDNTHRPINLEQIYCKLHPSSCIRPKFLLCSVASRDKLEFIRFHVPKFLLKNNQ